MGEIAFIRGVLDKDIISGGVAPTYPCLPDHIIMLHDAPGQSFAKGGLLECRRCRKSRGFSRPPDFIPLADSRHTVVIGWRYR